MMTTPSLSPTIKSARIADRLADADRNIKLALMSARVGNEGANF
jgi:hypothetical protein